MNLLRATRVFLLRLSLPVLLRLWSLDRLVMRLARRRSPAPLAEVSAALTTAERWVSASRVVPDTCLYRALARFALFARHGHAAAFVVAVVNADPETAHAWVELDGAPWGEELDRAYTVIIRWPPQGSSETRSSNGPDAEPTVSATTK